MPGQVVLFEGGQIDSAQRHLAAKGLSNEPGQPPVDRFEHALLFDARDACDRSAKAVATAVSHFDKDQRLSVAHDQVELA